MDRRCLYLDVFATLPEALGQHGDHVFVVVQKLLHQFTETCLDVLVFNLENRKMIKAHISTRKAVKCQEMTRGKLMSGMTHACTVYIFILKK